MGNKHGNLNKITNLKPKNTLPTAIAIINEDSNNSEYTYSIINKVVDVYINALQTYAINPRMYEINTVDDLISFLWKDCKKFKLNQHIYYVKETFNVLDCNKSRTYDGYWLMHLKQIVMLV